MILLVIAVLSTLTASQGEIVNLTLASDAKVVLDGCMYFEGYYTNVENLSAGSYQIYITHMCEGEKRIRIFANGSEEEVPIYIKKSNAAEDVIRLEEEILELKKQIKTLKNENEYLKYVLDAINRINVDLHDRLMKCNSKVSDLTNELSIWKEQAGNYSSLIERLQNELKSREETLNELQNTTSELEEKLNLLELEAEKMKNFVYYYESLFIFATSLLVGLVFSFLRR